MQTSAKWIPAIVAAMLTAAAASGCGSDSGNGGGGGGGASGAAGAGGTTAQSGECTPGDPARGCADGATCEQVVAGGFAVCAPMTKEATVCTGSALDECCSTANCTTGKCFSQPTIPSQVCNGAADIVGNNVCAADQCNQDADCGDPTLACAARGAIGNAVKACMPARCRVDADCQASTGGSCALVKDPCCDSVAGLFCVYPDQGCRSSADCGDGDFCDPDEVTGAAHCRSGAPECLR